MNEKYNYNLSGSDRKSLVEAISQILEQPAVYQGAPNFSYIIGDFNEKYKGDLLLQKYYTPDFRTKKHAVNRGERRQYYVEDSHEPIVDKETFEAVRQEREIRRKKYCHAPQDNQKKHLFCGLIRCGYCRSTFKFQF